MLTDEQRAILDLETTHPHPSTKHTAIWDQLGILPARYYQQLNALIDQADANEYAPLLCSRLRRLRDARVAARAR